MNTNKTDGLKVIIDEQIATITIDAPPVNAFTLELLAAL